MQLITSLQKLIHPFIESADTSITSSRTGHTKPLLDYHEPKELSAILKLDLPENGVGKEGFMEVVNTILKYSVNTWDRGFMDKLYASTNAVRNWVQFGPFSEQSHGQISFTFRQLTRQKSGRSSIRPPPQHPKHKCPRLYRLPGSDLNREIHYLHPRLTNRLHHF